MYNRTKATLSTKIEAGHQEDIAKLAALIDRYNEKFEGTPAPFSIIPEHEFADLSRHEDVVTWLEGLGFALTEGNLDQMAYKWTGSVLELTKAMRSYQKRSGANIPSLDRSFSLGSMQPTQAPSRFRSASDSAVTSPLFGEKSVVGSCVLLSPNTLNRPRTKSVSIMEDTTGPWGEGMPDPTAPTPLGPICSSSSPRACSKQMQEFKSKLLTAEARSRSLSASSGSVNLSASSSVRDSQDSDYRRPTITVNTGCTYEFTTRRRSISSPSTSTDAGSPRSLQSPFGAMPSREILRSISKESVNSVRSTDSSHSARESPILAGLKFLQLNTNSVDDAVEYEGQEKLQDSFKATTNDVIGIDKLEKPQPHTTDATMSSSESLEIEPQAICAVNDSVHEIMINNSMMSDASTIIESTPNPHSDSQSGYDEEDDQEIIEANSCQVESLPPLAPRALHRKNSKDSLTSLNYSAEDHRAVQDLHSLQNTSSDSHMKTLLDSSLCSPDVPPRIMNAYCANEDDSFKKGADFNNNILTFNSTFQFLDAGDRPMKRTLRRSQTAPIAYHREPGLETPGAPVTLSQPNGPSSGGPLCTPGQTLNPWRYLSEPASDKACEVLTEMLNDHLKSSGNGLGVTPRMTREYELEAQASMAANARGGVFESMSHANGSGSGGRGPAAGPAAGYGSAGPSRPERKLVRSFSAIVPGTTPVLVDLTGPFSGFPVFSNEKNRGGSTSAIGNLSSLSFSPNSVDTSAGSMAFSGLRSGSANCIPAQPVDLEAFQGAQRALSNIINKKTSAAVDRDASFSFDGQSGEVESMRRRARKSASTWKRRSMSGTGNRSTRSQVHRNDNECSMDMSYDQPPTRKLFSRSRRLSNVFERRKSVLVQGPDLPKMISDDDTDDDTDANDNAFGDVSSSMNRCPLVSSAQKVSARTFKGIVQGGVYQNVFDDNRPIITPARSADIRVTASEVLSTGELVVKLFRPNDSVEEAVRFSKGWTLTRVSPDGFLVGENDIMESENAVYYYLAKLPKGYIGSAVKHSSRASTERYEDLRCTFTEMDCSAPDHECDVSTCDAHVQPPRPDVQPSRGYAYWSDDAVVLQVLSYFSTAELAGYALPSSNSSHTRIGREHKNPRLSGLAAVSKTWALCAYRHIANRLSAHGGAVYDYSNWAKFFSRFNSGKFLTRGACKEVYKVTRDNCTDAVSVLDMKDLQARDMHHCIAQEMAILLTCSSMVRLNICPNLVEVYSVFSASHPVPTREWGARRRIPTESSLPVGEFQFIHTEFCAGGDLEHVVRTKGELDPATVRALLFQMCFALYSCREKLQLRHFDIKLLNFFVTNGSAALGTHDRHTGESSDGKLDCKSANPFEASSERSLGTVDVHIGIGGDIYTLQLGETDPSFVKLSDFGTSAIGEEELGVHINEMQFTTLENTPPEFLLFGSIARQAYSADTFCLGLSYLHLLTGYEPYEELLKDVHCPAYLHSRLKPLWETKDKLSPYFVIAELLESLDLEEGSEGATSAPGMVLYDTFYRYLVLLGIPEELTSPPSSDAHGESIWTGNPVWGAVMKAFGLASQRQTKAQAACQAQYADDRKLWNMEAGQSQIIVGVRKRLEFLGEDATEMLYAMLDFDPSKRCSMIEILSSRLFAPLRNQPGVHETYRQRMVDEADGLDSLPGMTLGCKHDKPCAPSGYATRTRQRADTSMSSSQSHPATHARDKGIGLRCGLGLVAHARDKGMHVDLVGEPSLAAWYMHYYTADSVAATNLPNF